MTHDERPNQDIPAEGNIDTTDIPPTDFSVPRQYFRGRELFPELVEPRGVLIDEDVLVWFHDHHERYQAAINQALREYMERHQKAS